MTYRVLFLTESREDYLADSLLHGLISLGHEIVDYPRKHVLYTGYKNCPVMPRLEVRGHGFTLYGLLDDRSVDRSFAIQRLQDGWFDLVVIGQIWRQWGQLLDLAPFLQQIPIVLLDGDDDNRLFHYSGTRIRRYGWQPFPIRSGQCFYFKRELMGHEKSTKLCHIRPANFSIPAEKVRFVDFSSKQRTFARHCVDDEVATAASLASSYAFASEKEYYDDLASSRFAVTCKRGGWDCLRHYEIAAAGSLLCFRQLGDKPSSCAPHGLYPGVNCISYTNWSDLQRQIHDLSSSPTKYHQMLINSTDWVSHHTTTSAAQRLLDEVMGL